MTTRKKPPDQLKREAQFSVEKALQVMKAANLEPLVRYPGSGKPWRSRCLRCKHLVSPRYNSVQQTGSGCRYCGATLRGSKRRKTDSEARQHMRARFADPIEPYSSAKSPWKCQCMKCKRKFQIRYDNARYVEIACPYCNGSRHDPNELRQKLLKKGLKPVEPFPGVKKKWKVECQKCGLLSSRRTDGRAALERPCPFCTRRRTHEHTAIQILNRAGLKPLMKFPGANTPWKSRCNTCLRVVTPRLSNIRRGQNGCAYCSGHIVPPSEAVKLMRSAGLTPLVPFKSATQPWRCRCVRCRRVVNPRYNDISNGQGGCFYCANRGFDYSKPAILYLLRHTNQRILKIGITGSTTKESRLATHVRFGWKVVAVWEKKNAVTIARAEREVLNWWRSDLKQGPAITKTKMPQGGSTETVSTASVSSRAVIARVCKSLGSPTSFPGE
jgi:hypothetical protein